MGDQLGDVRLLRHADRLAPRARRIADLLFPGRRPTVLERYNVHELDVEAVTPTMRYRDVMAESLRRAAADLGLAICPTTTPPSSARRSRTGRHSPRWPPSSAALRAGGWRLALLTNCDRDIIGAAQRRLGAVIDAVVTAEHVGSYKPAPRHFRRFEESFAPPRHAGPRRPGVPPRHGPGHELGCRACGSTASARTATSHLRERPARFRPARPLPSGSALAVITSPPSRASRPSEHLRRGLPALGRHPARTGLSSVG